MLFLSFLAKRQGSFLAAALLALAVVCALLPGQARATVDISATVSTSTNAGIGGAPNEDVRFLTGTLEATGSFSTSRAASIIDGTIQTDPGVTLTWGGVISGSGWLDKEGSGTLILNNQNTYSGEITVWAGTLVLGVQNAMVSGSVGGWGGAVLDMSAVNNNQTLKSLYGPASVLIGANTLTLNGANCTFGGSISGTGGLTLIGGSGMVMSVAQAYTGATTITSGTLRLQAANAIASSSGVVMSAGGTLDISNFAGSQTIQGLSGSGNVYLGARNLIVTGGGSYSGSIQDGGFGGGTRGSLTVSGGTLTLSGTNSYTGGTTVNAGILQGDTTSLQGNITDNAQVTFNQGTNGTYSGVISGTGSLTKTGAGTLILSGANNYTGATNINAGALSVNGSITSPVNVGAAGTLMGSGTITGNTVNSGTLAPGNSIGTLTIAGNYTQNAGSTYQVEVNAAGQSDKLIVTGTATINGGTVSVLAESGTYNAHTTYTILTAGSIVGTFAAVTSNLAFLTPSLSYDPTNVYLLLTRNSTGFADVAVTPSQRSVASTLDRIASASTGDMENIINNLLGLSGQGARSAYDQMGGLSHASLMEAASFSANRYIGILSGRMGGFSTGGTALSDAGNILLAFNENTGSDAGNMLLAAINSTRENGGMKENGMNALPRGLWAKGYGSIGERRGDEISTKYDYRGGGLIVGFDRKLSERLLLGAAAGYSYTKVNMNSLNDDGRVASYQGSLYGAYSIDPWYVNGLIAYGYNRYDTTRNIVFGGIARTAHADYGGHSLSGYAETGYRIKTNAVDIIPMASIQAGSLWRNAFTESDAGALDLNADSDRTSSFIGSLGVKLRKEYKTKIGSITPEIRARWLHEFANNDYALNASFAYTPASTFSVRGDSARKDSAALGAGLNWEINKSFGLAFTYDATLSGDRTEHGGTAGIRFRW